MFIFCAHSKLFCKGMLVRDVLMAVFSKLAPPKILIYHIKFFFALRIIFDKVSASALSEISQIHSAPNHLHQRCWIQQLKPFLQ
jgi:hypothetical protein